MGCDFACTKYALARNGNCFQQIRNEHEFVLSLWKAKNI